MQLTLILLTLSDMNKIKPQRLEEIMNYISAKIFRPILSLILAICLAASAISITVFGSDNSQQDVLGLLSELKIMNGDLHGNL